MKLATIIVYLASIVALFFYSFTQVDLSLTLINDSFFQQVEKTFQYIGYFQRPLSTMTYSFVVVFLFISYIFLIRLVREELIKWKTVKRLMIFTACLLVFSYTAFSYDIFNYIFDAKIITHYHENPYIHKALDYPGDPMLSFMHWTHRVYP